LLINKPEQNAYWSICYYPMAIDLSRFQKAQIDLKASDKRERGGEGGGTEGELRSGDEFSRLPEKGSTGPGRCN